MVRYNFKADTDACFTTKHGVFYAMAQHDDCCREGWRTGNDTLKMACDTPTSVDVYMYEAKTDSCAITRTFTHIDDYTTYEVTQVKKADCCTNSNGIAELELACA